jgi:hypothetical protein
VSDRDVINNAARKLEGPLSVIVEFASAQRSGHETQITLRDYTVALERVLAVTRAYPERIFGTHEHPNVRMRVALGTVARYTKLLDLIEGHNRFAREFSEDSAA